MSTTLPVPAMRQAGVLAAIVALHVGAFAAVTAGIGDGIELPPVLPTDIFVLPPVIEPVVGPRPDPVLAGDYQPETVKAPDLDIPVGDEGEGAGATRRQSAFVEGGMGPVLPAPDYRGPTMRTRDARLQALIDSCYPSVARRLGQEGRGVVRIVVDSTGRVRSASVDQSTGFAELDSGMDCIAGRLQFEPGRRDGQPVDATVLLPILFRLR
jgi:protein TonB